MLKYNAVIFALNNSYSHSHDKKHYLERSNDDQYLEEHVW